MNKKKLALFLKIGFPKKIAEAMATDGELPDDFNADEAHDEVRETLGATFADDPEFVKPIRTAVIGEVLSGRERNLLKLVGKDVMTQDELEKLPAKDRYDAALAAVVKKLQATKPDPNADKDANAKWEQDRTKLLEEIQGLTTEVNKYKTEVVPGLEKKAVDIEHGFHIRGQIGTAATAKDRKTVLAGEKTVALLYDDIRAEFDLVYDPEKRRTVLHEKGKGVIARNPVERAKELTLDDVVTTIGERNGYFVMNNGNGGQGGQGGNGQGGNGQGGNADKPKYTPPGLAAAEAHATKLAAEVTK